MDDVFKYIYKYFNFEVEKINIFNNVQKNMEYFPSQIIYSNEFLKVQSMLS